MFSYAMLNPLWLLHMENGFQLMPCLYFIFPLSNIVEVEHFMQKLYLQIHYVSICPIT